MLWGIGGDAARGSCDRALTRPGIGKLVYEAISTRNYPIVSGAVLVTTVFFVLVNVAADILVGTLDPRVRASFN